jgi:hypothetical protein
MAKPRVVTDLQVWMVETGRTDISLAAELSAILRQQGHKEINERQLGRWRKGLALPRYPRFMALLTELSRGRVTADSFVESRMKDDPAARRLIDGGFMGNVVDLEAVHNVLGEAKVSPLSENSELGAIARLEHDVTLAMTLWRSKEINRDTHPAHVGHALLRGFEAVIGGHILQHVAPEDQPRAAFSLAMELLSDLMTIVGATEEDRRKYMTRIDSVEAGMA